MATQNEIRDAALFLRNMAYDRGQQGLKDTPRYEEEARATLADVDSATRPPTRPPVRAEDYLFRKPAPSSLGEHFSAGLGAAAQGMYASGYAAKAVLESLFGAKPENIADTLARMEDRQFVAAQHLEGTQTFGEFIDDAAKLDFSGLGNQAMSAVGQVAPSLAIALASAGVGGAVAGVAGGGLRMAGAQLAGRAASDIATRAALASTSRAATKELADTAAGTLIREGGKDYFTGETKKQLSRRILQVLDKQGRGDALDLDDTELLGAVGGSLVRRQKYMKRSDGKLGAFIGLGLSSYVPNLGNVGGELFDPEVLARDGSPTTGELLGAMAVAGVGSAAEVAGLGKAFQIVTKFGGATGSEALKAAGRLKQKGVLGVGMSGLPRVAAAGASIAGRAVVRGGKVAGIEGTTEAFQESLAVGFRGLTDAEYDYAGDLMRVGQAFFTGAVGMGLLGTAATVPVSALERRRDVRAHRQQQAQEPPPERVRDLRAQLGQTLDTQNDRVGVLMASGKRSANRLKRLRGWTKYERNQLRALMETGKAAQMTFKGVGRFTIQMLGTPENPQIVALPSDAAWDGLHPDRKGAMAGVRQYLDENGWMSNEQLRTLLAEYQAEADPEPAPESEVETAEAAIQDPEPDPGLAPEPEAAAPEPQTRVVVQDADGNVLRNQVMPDEQAQAAADYYRQQAAPDQSVETMPDVQNPRPETDPEVTVLVDDDYTDPDEPAPTVEEVEMWEHDAAQASQPLAPVLAQSDAAALGIRNEPADISDAVIISETLAPQRTASTREVVQMPAPQEPGVKLDYTPEPWLLDPAARQQVDTLIREQMPMIEQRMVEYGRDIAPQAADPEAEIDVPSMGDLQQQMDTIRQAAERRRLPAPEVQQAEQQAATQQEQQRLAEVRELAMVMRQSANAAAMRRRKVTQPLADPELLALLQRNPKANMRRLSKDIQDALGRMPDAAAERMRNLWLDADSDTVREGLDLIRQLNDYAAADEFSYGIIEPGTFNRLRTLLSDPSEQVRDAAQREIKNHLANAKRLASPVREAIEARKRELVERFNPQGQARARTLVDEVEKAVKINQLDDQDAVYKALMLADERQQRLDQIRNGMATGDYGNPAVFPEPLKQAIQQYKDGAPPDQELAREAIGILARMDQVAEGSEIGALKLLLNTFQTFNNKRKAAELTQERERQVTWMRRHLREIDDTALHTEIERQIAAEKDSKAKKALQSRLRDIKSRDKASLRKRIADMENLLEAGPLGDFKRRIKAARSALVRKDLIHRMFNEMLAIRFYEHLNSTDPMAIYSDPAAVRYGLRLMMALAHDTSPNFGQRMEMTRLGGKWEMPEFEGLDLSRANTIDMVRALGEEAAYKAIMRIVNRVIDGDRSEVLDKMRQVEGGPVDPRDALSVKQLQELAQARAEANEIARSTGNLVADKFGYLAATNSARRFVDELTSIESDYAYDDTGQLQELDEDATREPGEAAEEVAMHELGFHEVDAETMNTAAELLRADMDDRSNNVVDYTDPGRDREGGWAIYADERQRGPGNWIVDNDPNTTEELTRRWDNLLMGMRPEERVKFQNHEHLMGGPMVRYLSDPDRQFYKDRDLGGFEISVLKNERGAQVMRVGRDSGGAGTGEQSAELVLKSFERRMRMSALRRGRPVQVGSKWQLNMADENSGIDLWVTRRVDKGKKPPPIQWDTREAAELAEQTRHLHVKDDDGNTIPPAPFLLAKVETTLESDKKAVDTDVEAAPGSMTLLPKANLLNRITGMGQEVNKLRQDFVDAEFAATPDELARQGLFSGIRDLQMRGWHLRADGVDLIPTATKIVHNELALSRAVESNNGQKAELYEGLLAERRQKYPETLQALDLPVGGRTLRDVLAQRPSMRRSRDKSWREIADQEFYPVLTSRLKAEGKAEVGNMGSLTAYRRNARKATEVLRYLARVYTPQLQTPAYQDRSESLIDKIDANTAPSAMFAGAFANIDSKKLGAELREYEYGVDNEIEIRAIRNIVYQWWHGARNMDRVYVQQASREQRLWEDEPGTTDMDAYTPTGRMMSDYLTIEQNNRAAQSVKEYQAAERELMEAWRENSAIEYTLEGLNITEPKQIANAYHESALELRKAALRYQRAESTLRVLVDQDFVYDVPGDSVEATFKDVDIAAKVNLHFKRHYEEHGQPKFFIPGEDPMVVENIPFQRTPLPDDSDPMTIGEVIDKWQKAKDYPKGRDADLRLMAHDAAAAQALSRAKTTEDILDAVHKVVPTLEQMANMSSTRLDELNYGVTVDPSRTMETVMAKGRPRIGKPVKPGPAMWRQQIEAAPQHTDEQRAWRAFDEFFGGVKPTIDTQPDIKRKRTLDRKERVAMEANRRNTVKFMRQQASGIHLVESPVLDSDGNPTDRVRTIFTGNRNLRGIKTKLEALMPKDAPPIYMVRAGDLGSMSVDDIELNPSVLARARERYAALQQDNDNARAFVVYDRESGGALIVSAFREPQQGDSAAQQQWDDKFSNMEAMAIGHEFGHIWLRWNVRRFFDPEGDLTADGQALWSAYKLAVEQNRVPEYDTGQRQAFDEFMADQVAAFMLNNTPTVEHLRTVLRERGREFEDRIKQTAEQIRWIGRKPRVETDQDGNVIGEEQPYSEEAEQQLNGIAQLLESKDGNRQSRLAQAVEDLSALGENDTAPHLRSDIWAAVETLKDLQNRNAEQQKLPGRIKRALEVIKDLAARLRKFIEDVGQQLYGGRFNPVTEAQAAIKRITDDMRRQSMQELWTPDEPVRTEVLADIADFSITLKEVAEGGWAKAKDAVLEYSTHDIASALRTVFVPSRTNMAWDGKEGKDAADFYERPSRGEWKPEGMLSKYQAYARTWFEGFAKSLGVDAYGRMRQWKDPKLARLLDEVASAGDKDLDGNFRNPNISAEAQQVLDFFTKLQEHLPEGTDIRERYFPRGLNVDVMRTGYGRNKLAELMVEYLPNVDDLDTALPMVDRIVDQATVNRDSEAMMEGPDTANRGGFTPRTPNALGRTLALIPYAALREAGIALRPDLIASNYIDRLAKRRAFDEQGGEERIAELRTAYVEAGQTPDDKVKRAQKFDRFNRAMLGQVDHLPPVLRSAVNFLRTAQLWSLLPLALASQFPEIAYAVLRSNGVLTFGAAMQQLMRTLKEKDGRFLARAVGAVGPPAQEVMFATIGDASWQTEAHRRANELLFRVTGLDAFTTFVKSLAAGLGREYMVEAARNQTDMNKRLLAELNVTPEEVLAWEADGFALEGRENIQTAIRQFVREGTPAPNPATRPLLGGHPLGSLLYVLHAFYYASGVQVLAGIGREVSTRWGMGERGSAAMMVAAMLVTTLPLAAIGLEVKEWTKWGMRHGADLVGVDVPPPNGVFLSDHMGATEYMAEITDRAGLLGPLSLVKGFTDSVGYGQGPVDASISLFPVLDWFRDVMSGDVKEVAPLMRTM